MWFQIFGGVMFLLLMRRLGFWIDQRAGKAKAASDALKDLQAALGEALLAERPNRQSIPQWQKRLRIARLVDARYCREVGPLDSGESCEYVVLLVLVWLRQSQWCPRDDAAEPLARRY
ncbi:MAG TPA: hypothetical protein VMT81_02775 [Candidatus Paceibacterota bacterium]|nr:hypothetical protein [Candidatus Paceibacterota bacterium]